MAVSTSYPLVNESLADFMEKILGRKLQPHQRALVDKYRTNRSKSVRHLREALANNTTRMPLRELMDKLPGSPALIGAVIRFELDNIEVQVDWEWLKAIEAHEEWKETCTVVEMPPRYVDPTARYCGHCLARLGKGYTIAHGMEEGCCPVHGRKAPVLHEDAAARVKRAQAKAIFGPGPDGKIEDRRKPEDVKYDWRRVEQQMRWLEFESHRPRPSSLVPYATVQDLIRSPGRLNKFYEDAAKALAHVYFGEDRPKLLSLDPNGRGATFSDGSRMITKDGVHWQREERSSDAADALAMSLGLAPLAEEKAGVPPRPIAGHPYEELARDETIGKWPPIGESKKLALRAPATGGVVAGSRSNCQRCHIPFKVGELLGTRDADPRGTFVHMTCPGFDPLPGMLGAIETTPTSYSEYHVSVSFPGYGLARFPPVCRCCVQMFLIGDEVQTVDGNGRMVVMHRTCLQKLQK